MRLSFLLAAPCLSFTAAAWAHPGHASHLDAGLSFWDGVLHPLTGADHLVVMLSVGIWGALVLRSALPVSAAFIALLLVGALMASTGLVWPGVEPLILASVVAMGLLIARRLSLSALPGSLLVGLFAVSHGMAHGQELAGGAALVGMVLTTGLLLATGIAIGRQMARQGPQASRLVGGTVGLTGLGLALAPLLRMG